ncbi:MAG: hypothetical protein A2X52_20770 [Candidatus Rokubacteria bacterium GWC2_70_16]|nr:MAG: hypothetical protein A2X52_20770 [Candidatus Rokubacteria bacterium GWC2_70_16]OGL18283.1 MAG: hypothetical protein A3K12_11035 [Candidatus Rokubacteria bacterium RIFCSPLOWO2_12_FULL_71_19]
MILPELRLDGRPVLVVGRGRHHLDALAAALGEAGASVALAGPDGAALARAAAAGRAAGARALALPTDLDLRSSVEETVARVESELGPLEVLVTDLDAGAGRPALEIGEEEWAAALGAHLAAVFRCCRAAAARMLPRGRGRIVTVVSALAVHGMPGGAAYGASMAGVVGLVRALALEWAARNISVNAVAMGWMEGEPDAAPGDSIERYIPARRRARAEDLAAAVLFLAGDGASYVTGHVHMVDGGVHARG